MLQEASLSMHHALGLILLTAIGSRHFPEDPGQQQPEFGLLDELLQESDKIVIGSVHELHSVEQVLPLMEPNVWPRPEITLSEIRIERVLLGRPAASRAFVYVRHLEDGPVEGERALFWLREWRGVWLRASSATRVALDATTEGEEAYVFRGDYSRSGYWRIEAGRFELPAAFDGVDLPEELSRALPRSTDAVVQWVDSELDSLTPALYAAQGRWFLKVAADASWRSKGDAGKLSPEEQARLWSAVRESELDRRGQTEPTTRMEARVRALRVRTRRGTYWTRVYTDWEPPEEAYGELRERVDRVWALLPGKDRP